MKFGAWIGVAGVNSEQGWELEAFGAEKSSPKPSNETLTWVQGEGSSPPKLLIISMFLSQLARIC